MLRPNLSLPISLRRLYSFMYVATSIIVLTALSNSGLSSWESSVHWKKAHMFIFYCHCHSFMFLSHRTTRFSPSGPLRIAHTFHMWLPVLKKNFGNIFRKRNEVVTELPFRCTPNVVHLTIFFHLGTNPNKTEQRALLTLPTPCARTCSTRWATQGRIHFYEPNILCMYL
jgi:hypothetical protein